MAKMVINTEKFMEWLDRQIVAEYRMEAASASEGNYAQAMANAEARKTFEFVKLSITGEERTDIGDFMEEVDG